MRWMFLTSTLFRYFEGWRVFFKYYRNLSFAKTDLLYLMTYLLRSPLKIHRREAGEELHVYGETPLSTIDRIARECHLQSSDRVVDLGCGAGRAAFWLAHFVKCRVVGVDLTSSFIKRGRRIAALAKVDRINFREEDLFTTDLRGASVVYLYGTCFSDEQIETLSARLGALPSGTKIVSVTYPLSAYSPHFRLQKSFPARFPWGKSEVFIDMRR